MASNGNDAGSQRDPLSASEREALKRRTSELGRKLDQVHARKAPATGDPRARGNAIGQAFKILTELVVGVVVGGGIGWFLDRQLGTSPWLSLLFLIVGFAAGLSNVIRTARKMQAAAEPLQRSAPSVPDDADEEDSGKRGNSPPVRPVK